MSQKLTQVRGIGPSTAKIIEQHGIRSVERLASATLAQLTAISGFSTIRARQVKADAKAVLKDPEAKKAAKSAGGVKAKSSTKKTSGGSSEQDKKAKNKKSAKDKKSKKDKKKSKKESKAKSKATRKNSAKSVKKAKKKK